MEGVETTTGTTEVARDFFFGVDDDPAPALCVQSERVLFRSSQRLQSIVPYEDMKHRLLELTQGWLHHLPSGFIVAGGAVLHALVYPEIAVGDIDVFICGHTEQTAKAAVSAFLRAVLGIFPASVLHRTENSVVVSGIGIKYPLQVVLRLFADVHDVLNAFDVDCCAFAFEGERVWALPRAVRALRDQCNTVDPQRHRSWAYEARLLKYSARGFAICVPDLDRARLRGFDEARMDAVYDRSTGLQRLLMAEQRARLGMWIVPPAGAPRQTIRSSELVYWSTGVSLQGFAAQCLGYLHTVLIAYDDPLYFVTFGVGAPPRGLYDPSDWHRGIYSDDPCPAVPALPWDCLALVFAELPVATLASARRVCVSWRTLLSDPCFWYTRLWRDFGAVASSLRARLPHDIYPALYRSLYTLANVQWYKLKPTSLPVAFHEVARHSCVRFGDRLILYGGVRESRVYSDVWVYDTAHNTMFRQDIDVRPPGRFQHGYWVLGDYMYVLYGRDDDSCNYDDCWALHIPTWQWFVVQLLGNGPAACSGLTTTLLDDNETVLVMGGFALGEQRPLSSVFALERQEALVWSWGRVTRAGPHFVRAAVTPQVLSATVCSCSEVRTLQGTMKRRLVSWRTCSCWTCKRGGGRRR